MIGDPLHYILRLI